MRWMPLMVPSSVLFHLFLAIVLRRRLLRALEMIRVLPFVAMRRWWCRRTPIWIRRSSGRWLQRRPWCSGCRRPCRPRWSMRSSSNIFQVVLRQVGLPCWQDRMLPTCPRRLSLMLMEMRMPIRFRSLTRVFLLSSSIEVAVPSGVRPGGGTFPAVGFHPPCEGGLVHVFNFFACVGPARSVLGTE